MATLRDYYFTDFKTLTMHLEYALDKPDASGKFKVTARTHEDFLANARYVSFFLEGPEYTLDNAVSLLGAAESLLPEMDSKMQVTTSHEAIYGPEISSNELPFSKIVHLYIDTNVLDTEKQQIVDSGKNLGLRVEIRDSGYSEYLSSHEKPLAFISHDSHDKDEIVRPLAEKLRTLLCPVWFDEFSLEVGDNIAESIDKGLRETPKCILIISPNFLSNSGWTKEEFNTAMAKHAKSGGSVILPVWHNVKSNDVENYSLMLSGIKALDSADGIDKLAVQLLKKITPQN